MTYKIDLELKDGAAPHLYINQIRDIIKDDKELTKPMENTLRLMRKFRKDHIILPTKFEVLVVYERHLNYERSVDTPFTIYSKAPWTEEDIKEYNTDKKKYLAAVLKMYDKMGYNIEMSEISDPGELIQ